jgi:ABC-type transport system involved in cytochrome c biogenesis ATPase subunit
MKVTMSVSLIGVDRVNVLNLGAGGQRRMAI